jgi:hypothetical protein
MLYFNFLILIIVLHVTQCFLPHRESLAITMWLHAVAPVLSTVDCSMRPGYFCCESPLTVDVSESVNIYHHGCIYSCGDPQVKVWKPLSVAINLN